VANVTKPNMSEAFFMARDLAPDHPDVVSGRRFRSANQWPEGLPGFRELLVAYCDALERLVQRLVRVYARALDLPAAYFDGPFTTSSTNCARPTTRHGRRRPTTNSASRRIPIRVS
jgi:isopenicillin N synthase-like dioxygenase